MFHTRVEPSNLLSSSFYMHLFNLGPLKPNVN